MSENTFRTLALDGGGIRGAYGARLLELIEDDLPQGERIADYFNLVAGTSTGAILAAAVAMRVPAREIRELYENIGPEIFKSAFLCFPKGLLKRKYSNEALQQALEDKFEGIRMADVPTPLCIAALSTATYEPRVIKTPHYETNDDDSQVLLVDAIMASAAAPVYFDAVPIAYDRFVDGGLWANNPSLIAVTEVCEKAALTFGDLDVLNIGTGDGEGSVHGSKKYERIAKNSLLAWKGDLIEAMTVSQSEYTRNVLERLMPDGYCRLSFTKTDDELALDSVDRMDTLFHYARATYQDKADEVIARFFEDRPPESRLEAYLSATKTTSTA